MNAWRLLADIGGTNARFARSGNDGGLAEKRSYDVADFKDFEYALETYLAETGGAHGCASAALGAAGPVQDGQVYLTNVPWRIDEFAISEFLGGVPVLLVNDLEAVALSLPHLADKDISPVGDIGRLPKDMRRMLALNVGTGFGAAAIVRAGKKWVTCPSEAGHMSLGARDEAELAVLAGNGASGVTVEDVLSGQGLMSLYRNVCRRLGAHAAAASTQDVLSGAPSDAASEETVAAFTKLLGRVAGDLALAAAAWDGVFLTGGVVEGWAPRASARLFRDNFEKQGKMRERLRRTYTGVITRRDAALLGLLRV